MSKSHVWCEVTMFHKSQKNIIITRFFHRFFMDKSLESHHTLKKKMDKWQWVEISHLDHRLECLSFNDGIQWLDPYPNGSFLSHRGYPQSSYVIHFCGDFPRKKPSSYWGSPMTMETPNQNFAPKTKSVPPVEAAPSEVVRPPGSGVRNEEWRYLTNQPLRIQLVYWGYSWFIQDIGGSVHFSTNHSLIMNWKWRIHTWFCLF